MMMMMACEGSQDTCARALFERDMIMYKEARESCSHVSQVMRMMMIVIMAIRINSKSNSNNNDSSNDNDSNHNDND